ncbi:unnamed protein product [Penicillium roqueforti FM164]|uniref:Genomic scaffold, ProqFM164S02 n=1 Tax=Penicillium roqueforti (strain FM164) TaxID=1365484 RepID=W6Q3N6_PENRF|nr:unnamed protein product [Penicillium roqueforti FM164]
MLYVTSEICEEPRFAPDLRNGDHGCSCGSSCQCPAGACNCPKK